jgi:hypothetical protein
LRFWIPFSKRLSRFVEPAVPSLSYEQVAQNHHGTLFLVRQNMVFISCVCSGYPFIMMTIQLAMC